MGAAVLIVACNVLWAAAEVARWRRAIRKSTHSGAYMLSAGCLLGFAIVSGWPLWGQLLVGSLVAGGVAFWVADLRSEAKESSR